MQQTTGRTSSLFPYSSGIQLHIIHYAVCFIPLYLIKNSFILQMIARENTVVKLDNVFLQYIPFC